MGLAELPIVIWTEHLPPSANALFANVPGRGRVKSDRYREWQNAAGYDYNKAGASHISGPFKATITVCESKRRKGRDLDNFCKSVLDLAVKHRLVDDDSLAQEIVLRWGEAVGGLRLELEPFNQGGTDD